MVSQYNIPEFGLYGEIGDFPDVIHSETYHARAPIHGWRIAAHRHANMAQLFLIYDGAVSALVDGQPFNLKSGEYLFVPAQHVHQFQFKPDTEGHVISFPTALFAQIGLEVRTALSTPQTATISKYIKTLSKLINNSHRQPARFRSVQSVGLAQALLANLASCAAPTIVGTSSRLAELDRLIAQNLGSGWGPRDYAQKLFVTTGHLSRLCRTATGKGASAYIEARLMAEACRLLAFTQLPAFEIGHRLGFADPSHFSKRFRHAKGEAPSQYRSRFLG